VSVALVAVKVARPGAEITFMPASSRATRRTRRGHLLPEAEVVDEERASRCDVLHV
jgi:hypothetical protein